MFFDENGLYGPIRRFGVRCATFIVRCLSRGLQGFLRALSDGISIDGPHLPSRGTIKSIITADAFFYSLGSLHNDTGTNESAKLDNTKPAVGDTITVKVPFDKNGDGDETDTGDYLDLTSDDPDATVVWYRGSIEAKNKVGEGASYDVTADDNGKALYAVVTGAAGTEFIGSCEATTDEANKTIMSTEISRETPTVAVTTDMVVGDDPMTKGTKLYASTKDNNGDSVKDANLTFQWYAGGAAIDGATSSSYTIGDDDLKKFDKSGNNLVDYRVTVAGKDGYTGSAKDTITIKGATSATVKQRREDISVMKGDTYLAGGSQVNAGDTLTLAASYADSLSAMNIVWWYTAAGDGSDAEQFTGTSFTVPSDATTDSQIAVSLTLKADPGMWSNLDFDLCTTTTTEGKKDARVTTADLDGNTNRVVYAHNGDTTAPANWNALTTDGTGTTVPINCAKSLDSITVTYKVGDRTLAAPEVGATMTVAVKPQLADLSYKWEVNGVVVDSNDNDDPATATGAEVGEGANAYTITSADVNKKIKVTATAGGASAAYVGASIKYESEAVAASSRTIAQMKVLKYEAAAAKGTATDTWYYDATTGDNLNDKKDFINKKSVTAIATTGTYAIVAIDSDGELVNADDVYYSLYNFKSGVEKKVGAVQVFYAGAFFNEGDIAHFEVTPNQIGYTGSSVTYNLTSAVSDGGNTPAPTPTIIELAIAPTSAATATDFDDDVLTIAAGATVPFEATITGAGTANPLVKWFKGNGTQLKVGGTFTTPAAFIDGDSFYAEITVSGETYYSDVWTVEDREATLFSLEKTSSTTLACDDALSAVDQFGKEFDLKTNFVALGEATLTSVGGDHTAATATGAGGTTANLEKITLAGTGGTAFGAGDLVEFSVGLQTVTCTFTGATAYNIEID